MTGPQEGEQNYSIHREKKPAYFPWAELAAELRNTVYELTLVPPPGPISVWHDYSYKAPKACCVVNGTWKPNTSLVLLNKATHSEAAPFLFRGGFRFHDPATLDSFLKLLSKDRKKWIEHIELDIDRPVLYTFATLYSLTAATNLKRIVLSSLFFDMPCDTAEAAAQQLYKNWACHGWLQVWGKSKGNVRAGADVVCLTDRFLRSFAVRQRPCLTYKERRKTISEEAEKFRTALGNLLEIAACPCPGR